MIIEYLSRTWGAIAPSVGNHIWQSTLFALAAGLLTLPLRKNRATTRYWLWLAASWKFLIPFSMLVTVGNHLSWSRASARPDVGLYLAVKEVSQPFTPTVLPEVSRATTFTAPSIGSNLLPALFVALWLCGFLVILLIWYLRWRHISVAIRNTVSMPEGRELKTLRRLELAEGMPKQLEVRLSRVSFEPGIFGVVRPVLVWPDGISDRLADAHLQAILAHELWHVRRRDNLAAATHMLVQAIFWFHPFVWWLGSRLVAERERACDEAVLESGSDRHIYAESILKICEFCIGSPLTCVSGVTGADLQERISRIMTERVASKLDVYRKTLLCTAVLLALATPIAFGLLRSPETLAEPEITVAPVPSFEIASIESSPSGNEGTTVRSVPGRLTLANWTTRSLVAYAYNTSHIVGGPAWIDSERFVVDANVDDSFAHQAGKPMEFNAAGRFPPGFRHDQLRLVVQSLLADRFKLKLSRDTKQLTVYALVIAKNGPRLHEAKPNSTYANGVTDVYGLPVGLHPGAGQNGHLAVQSLPMATVAQILSEKLGNTVLDRTGLTGEYDFTLDWTPNENRSAARAQQDPGNPPAHESAGPSIVTAIEQQLGLKLEPQGVLTEFLAIDHVEKPVAPHLAGAIELESASVKPTPTGPGESGTSPVGQLDAPRNQPESPGQNIRADSLAYDVASIKPHKPDVGVVSLRSSADGFTATRATLRALIREAYGVADDQITQTPSWLNSDEYDIDAKADKSTIDALQKLDSHRRTLERQRMLQALLTDRFKLSVHLETKQGLAYALVIAKNGARLREAKPDESYVNGIKGFDGLPLGPHRTRMQSGELTAQALPMATVAQLLSMHLGRAVLDRTGLMGNYDFTLHWTPEQNETAVFNGPEGSQLRADSTSAESPGPSIFAAIQEQLGLKLESQKGPVQFLVIDHLERTPSEN